MMNSAVATLYQEAILLKKINKSLSIEQIERFRALNEKRLYDDITEPEYL